VEPLAARLGVTKGSFYWHFSDKATLHAAMLDKWRQRTREVIARFEQMPVAPRARLRSLIAYVTTSLDIARLDIAVRAWASHDAKAARMVAAVDAQRIDYIASILRDIGLDPPSARLRGQIIYLAVIGSNFAAAHGKALAQHDLWQELEGLVVPRRPRSHP
jgi:AcrR family transcriptional regulator